MSDTEFYSCFCYLGPFWLIGLFSDRKDDKTLRFHINQGLLLFCVELVLAAVAIFVGALIAQIPYVGGALCFVFRLAVIVYAFAMSFRGISDVVAGKQRRLPVIGFLRLIK